MASQLVILVALLACVSYCSAIKCYSCFSRVGDKDYNFCNDPFKADQQDGIIDSKLHECNDYKWCKKTYKESDKMENNAPKIWISRGCANKPDLKSADQTTTTTEYYCQNTDGCNGASSMTMSAVVAGFVAAVAFVANRA